MTNTFKISKLLCILCIAGLIFMNACSTSKFIHDKDLQIKISNVDSGWAGNSVNTAVFRKNSLVSRGDTQFISFYDKDGFVMLGKRMNHSSYWELKKTTFKGNILDAHNVISMMVDQDGYLHLAWDHHNNALHYAKSLYPGSLEPGPEQPMTGHLENKISYPEFYQKPDGGLLFFYRDGGSGNGNLVINAYDLKTKKWKTLQSNLISGEGKRNAYWQACIDQQGTIHLSWVWRESPDVSSNHDLCYARSKDGGITWEKSDGTKYQLPIIESTAEIACAIPQHTELINQTSMCADEAGNPYIASYWRDENDTIPQFHLVYKNQSWEVQNLGFRKTAFSLSGTGTKRITISRPQILVWNSGSIRKAAFIFRDEERNNQVSVALSKDLDSGKWILKDLYSENVGSWEPTYDTELWKQKRELHLFVQKVEQADGEGGSALGAQMVRVLEWRVK